MIVNITSTNYSLKPGFILKLTLIMLKIKKVQKHQTDRNLIFKWRNDEKTVQNSLKNSNFTLNEFSNVFYNRYFDNLVPPLFATLKGTPFAFIGVLGRDPDDLSISINLDPNYRGKGLSREALMKALFFIKKNYDVNKIYAEIKDFNLPSIKLFTGIGFTYQGNRSFKDQKILKYLYDMTDYGCYI